MSAPVDPIVAEVQRQVAEIVASLEGPQQPVAWEPDVEGPECGSVPAHRSGRCGCWG